MPNLCTHRVNTLGVKSLQREGHAPVQMPVALDDHKGVDLLGGVEEGTQRGGHGVGQMLASGHRPDRERAKNNRKRAELFHGGTGTWSPEPGSIMLPGSGYVRPVLAGYRVRRSITPLKRV